MNATTLPAVHADAVADRRGIYEREFGFDTVVVSGAIHLTTRSVSGVIVPCVLGREALTRLDEVPVFSVDHHGHRMWVLLADAPCLPGETDRMTLQLFAIGAIPIFPRATIALPAPGDPRRVWLHPPDGRIRPAFAALADAVCEAAVHGPAGRG